MMDIYDQYGNCVVAVMDIPKEETGRSGIIRGQPLPESGGTLFEVVDMVEKPKAEDAPSNYAIIGRYILTPSIFDVLAETGRGSGGEIQLTDGLRRLLDRERVLAYKFRGRRHDAGEKLGFLQATVEFALRNEELGPSFRSYLKSLDLDNT